ncbi:UbiX family flavin prenyltransferase [Paraburkholderia sp. Ac-20347]|jgi:flavin prenyltransferase|uniref:UbiX family flavin prenyltransferase n=1 Tax=Paraburkholderia sp. Ac-20347 TaxID=2703892 RepID=UPI00197FD1DD|nr:UbiX family flavin prenyltransferase [Paraburkholderia sp. Ac-20347]MBN3809025.1 UbiX family flavin prenyltransferase [Paraburkholderia sp. Ac-20347]
MQKPRIVVGISGATGFQYGVKALQLLRQLEVETHLVMSNAAGLTREQETNYSREDVIAMADVYYPTGAVGAAISSGSFRTAGMLVAPCSMHTLAAIATGVTDNLLTRSADVVLKERRRLVLMVRETPLHLGHIRNMAAVTEFGATVFPPVPALYAGPQTVDQIISHSVARAIGLLGFDSDALPRWGESLPDITAEEAKT